MEKSTIVFLIVAFCVLQMAVTINLLETNYVWSFFYKSFIFFTDYEFSWRRWGWWIRYMQDFLFLYVSCADQYWLSHRILTEMFVQWNRSWRTSERISWSRSWSSTWSTTNGCWRQADATSNGWWWEADATTRCWISRPVHYFLCTFSQGRDMWLKFWWKFKVY